MRKSYVILVGLAVTAAIAAVAVWLGGGRGEPKAKNQSQIANSKGKNSRAVGQSGGRAVRKSQRAAKSAPEVVALRDAAVRRAMEARGAGEAVRQIVGLRPEVGGLGSEGRAGQSSASENGRNDVRARDLALNTLTRKASASDVAALRDFLKLHDDGEGGMNQEAFNALKNDVLDVLLRQEVMPEGIGRDIVEMFNDPDMDGVWRDYCVQYAGAFMERTRIMGEQDRARAGQASASVNGDMGDSAVPAPRSEREEVLAMMREAVGERDSTIAGTALLGLEAVARAEVANDKVSMLNDKRGAGERSTSNAQHSTFNETGDVGAESAGAGAPASQEGTVKPAEVAVAALEVAGDEGASAAARMTALRLCADRKLGEAAGVARELAQVGESVPLRMAAIAALGALGAGAEDRQILSALAADQDKGIARVAAAALKKLK